MFKRVGLAVFALMLLSASNVFAATVNVTVTKTAFTPANVTVTVGDSVKFVNGTKKPHSPTPTNTYSWTGVKVPKKSFKIVTPTQAGSFPYYCALHPSAHHGTVNVAMKVTPPAGDTETMFTVTLGTVKAPGVLTHQLYGRKNGGSWILLKNTAEATITFKFGATYGAGTWEMQSRLHYNLGGGDSGYSPILTVTVF
jgi:plastocyanin